MSGKGRKRIGLVPIFVSNTALEAEEVRCLLEGSGLTPVVFDAHLPQMIPALGAPVGGVRVMIPEDQRESAAEVLRDAGRLDSDLPVTGRSPHPYAAVAGGRRAFSLAMLLVAAAGFAFAALTAVSRALRP